MSKARASSGISRQEALALLGLDDVPTNRDEVRRAYKQALRRHPPDRDPDGFRQLRQALEALDDPLAHAFGWLLRPQPDQLPSMAVPGRAPRGASAAEALRGLALRLDVEWLRGLPHEDEEPAASREAAGSDASPATKPRRTATSRKRRR